ncbi:MAG: response regulator [Longimicrobiales bacterium]|nr:response regulator [Longimicrobiales bacterium]
MASILIIDDHPEILRVLRKVLEGAGHTVTEAPDGKTALRWFAGKPTDLVLTDIYMPEMDGLEFIMRVREAFPETRVIAMSGGGFLGKDQILKAAAILGARQILEKPFTSEGVLEAVERALVDP